MSLPPPVAISVALLSGKQLKVRLQPTDTAAELLASVEQQLGGSPLHDVQLCVGQERLGAGVLVAELAARLASDGGFVQALLSPSETKATDCVDREIRRLYEAKPALGWEATGCRPGAQLVIDVAKKCSTALETLLELNLDRNFIPLGEFMSGNPYAQDLTDSIVCAVHVGKLVEVGIGADAADALSCRRFAGLTMLLKESWVRSGRRQLVPDKHFFLNLFASSKARGDIVFVPGPPLFLTDMSFSNVSQRQYFQLEQLNEVVIAAIRDPEWHRRIGAAWRELGRDGEGLREAMEWLAAEHSQEAVRAAAAETIAAHLVPRAPEAPPPPPAREAAAEAAAEAPPVSDEQEVQQVAEAIEQSQAEAARPEQDLFQEAVLRSIVGLAAVTVDVVLLKYNHCQKWLIDALFAAGCTKLRSGAMILVPPGVRAAVADFLDEGRDLKASHVAVAPELESDIHSAVDAAKEALLRSERRSTKVTDREAIAVPGHRLASDVSVELSKDTAEYQVVRTFVHVPIHSSMRSASSFQHPSV